MVTTSVSVVPVVPFRWFRWFRWFRSGGYARYAGSGSSVPVVSFRCSGFYHMPNSRTQTTETEMSASMHIIGLNPVRMNLGLRFIITILQFQMISLDNS